MATPRAPTPDCGSSRRSARWERHRRMRGIERRRPTVKRIEAAGREHRAQRRSALQDSYRMWMGISISKAGRGGAT